MNLLFMGLLFIVGWILIIIIYGVTKSRVDEETAKEMVHDGNNLFGTGVAYFFANLVCYFFQYKILLWILFFLTVVLTILPLISCFFMLFSSVRFPQKLTGILNTVIPAVMSFNILFHYILHLV